MGKKELYDNYLSKLEIALNEDRHYDIDYILEYLYTSGIPDDILDEMYDVLQEATLYSELREKEYKEEALKYIEEFK